MRVQVPPRSHDNSYSWHDGHLAQWLARLTYIQKVAGSNPAVPTFENFKIVHLLLIDYHLNIVLAAVAHGVERYSEKVEVASASLARGTFIRVDSYIKRTI